LVFSWAGALSDEFRVDSPSAFNPLVDLARDMKINAFAVIERLRTSFWFIPALMVVAAVVLSITSIHLDISVKEKVIEKIGWIYAGGPEGARSVLAAIASSMITVAGVVFSVTVVILSLTSQQFGPRILRTFIRDRSNQFVLGSFVATFVFCLLVLRTVRGTSSDTDFVPYISVTLGIALAIVSIGVLIFFVHHAAASIQSSNIVAAISVELDAAIDRLYPERIGRAASEDAFAIPKTDDFVIIPSRVAGYVQTIDAAKLLKIMSDHGLLAVILTEPGAFVCYGSSLAAVYGKGHTRQIGTKVSEAFVIGEERTATQDVDFLFRQLTEIAVRALSPGINDPFTAIECLDRLTAGFRRLAEREQPSPVRRDDRGEARVIAPPQSFARMARLSLGSIRHYGQAHEEVLRALLHSIAGIAAEVRDDGDRGVLSDELRGAATSIAGWTDDAARRRIDSDLQKTWSALRTSSSRDTTSDGGDSTR
jgi:uncharacterized membrane protein